MTSPLKYRLREETDRGKNKPQTKEYLPNLYLQSQETRSSLNANPHENTQSKLRCAEQSLTRSKEQAFQMLVGGAGLPDADGRSRPSRC